jgi:hypothetical protein
MINGAMKLKKYIVLGREQIVHNLDGDDQRKVITEMYVRKPNTQVRGMFVEYEKFMYNEIVGDRGRDVQLMEGEMFMSIDGTAQEFIDLNYSSDSMMTHNIRYIKTYPNQKFIKRDRETSFHKEYDISIDDDGNLVQKQVGKNAPPPPPPPKAVADFSTIPAGSKYLYTRLDKGGAEECICTTDVGYWLKENAMNDGMLPTMSTSLDAIAPNGWSEIMENTIEPADGDFDALEKALQANPDWNEDVNFTAFLA